MEMTPSFVEFVMTRKKENKNIKRVPFIHHIIGQTSNIISVIRYVQTINFNHQFGSQRKYLIESKYLSLQSFASQ